MVLRLRYGEAVEGTQKCSYSDCEETFKWSYLFQFHPKSLVSFYEPKLTKVASEVTNHDKGARDAKCYCPYCGGLNFFKVNYKLIF